MFVSSCSPSQTCMRAERGVISRSLNGLRNPRLSCCESQAVLPALRFNLRPAQVKKRLIKRVGLPGGVSRGTASWRNPRQVQRCANMFLKFQLVLSCFILCYLHVNLPGFCLCL
jgi:hypothetical protein